jgi:uncharacterized protein YndB with AHSA1/START domain
VGQIQVSAQRTIQVPADLVYRLIADMREHHHRFLPDNFYDFQVESGGVGEGTVTQFKSRAGGRTRAFRMRTTEPEPGRVLTESDTESSMVTTFTVDPEDSGCRVTISSTWDGAGGIGGFFERTFAPRGLLRIYEDLLERLTVYIRADK